MSSSSRSSSPDFTATKRKRAFLNKFLSKTYHMVDQCPDDIASWSDAGDSFTIKDVNAFEQEILPKYFNHSKFSSFIRQLNFYGFNKMRSDPDLQVHTRAVRFSHEFFRKGQPDLLHKIQRTTASKVSDESSGCQVEALQNQVTGLQDSLKVLENKMDEKVETAVRALEDNYLARIANLEKSYESLLTSVVSQYQKDLTAASLLSLSPQYQQPTNLADLADYIRSKH